MRVYVRVTFPIGKACLPSTIFQGLFTRGRRGGGRWSGGIGYRSLGLLVNRHPGEDLMTDGLVFNFGV